MATWVAGFMMKDNIKWIHPFYDKLANDLIFNNKRKLIQVLIPNTHYNLFLLKNIHVYKYIFI
jgi:hypothetical protein